MKKTKARKGGADRNSKKKKQKVEIDDVEDEQEVDEKEGKIKQWYAEDPFAIREYEYKATGKEPEPEIPEPGLPGFCRMGTSIYFTDNDVPPALVQSMEKQLDAIAASSKDFHPGSREQVLNLIHPSMFPYVLGVTPLNEKARTDPKLRAEIKQIHSRLTPKTVMDALEEARVKGLYDPGMAAIIGCPTPSGAEFKEQKASLDAELEEEKKAKEEEDEERGEYRERDPHISEFQVAQREYLGRPYEDSQYQWLPAEYKVDEKGGVVIETRINNLSRHEYSGLYDDFANLFSHAVPLLEKSMRRTLRGSTVQVITKAANYVVKPGEQDYQGNWHVEGMSHERIAASAIFYYHLSPSLESGGLSFRRGYNRDDFSKQEELAGRHGLYDNQVTPVLDLGTVPTPPGRMLVFPNNIQHLVEAITNNGKKIGYRKIVCFFVCDPVYRVMSTLHTDEQDWSRIRSLIEAGLSTSASTLIFPKDVLNIILAYARTGFTLEQAKEIRLALMKQRKYFASKHNELFNREYSLCEH